MDKYIMEMQREREREKENNSDVFKGRRNQKSVQQILTGKYGFWKCKKKKKV